jgi:hypothetical protein
VARSRGATGPVIHNLSPWKLLITAPDAVEGRFRPAGQLGGAAGPLGADSPTLCRVMNRLCSRMPRIALE